MTTSRRNAAAVSAGVADGTLWVSLNDGRGIRLDLDRFPWLSWLRTATTAEQNRAQIEPNGFAVYWPELDDGIEVAHLLSLEPLEGLAKPAGRRS